MASYRFVNRRTGETEKLSVVDNQMCAILGVEERADKYNPVWDFFIMAAMGRLMKFGGFRLDPHMWAYIAEEFGNGFNGDDQCIRARATVLWLQSQYHFEAWG